MQSLSFAEEFDLIAVLPLAYNSYYASHSATP
jgi:hypothetical protein